MKLLAAYSSSTNKECPIVSIILNEVKRFLQMLKREYYYNMVGLITTHEKHAQKSNYMEFFADFSVW